VTPPSDFSIVDISDPRIMEGRGWAVVIRDGGPFPSHRMTWIESLMRRLP